MMEIIITSSVLIACILLLRLVFHKKLSRRLQYALWLIVALRLLIPVSFSAPISVMNAFESLGGRQAVSAEQIDGETQAKPQQPDNIVTEPIIDAGGQAVVDDMHEPVPTVPSPAVQPKIAPEDVAKAVWLIGAGAVGLWLLCVNIIFQIKLKKDRKPYSCGCSKLPVYVTTKVQTPCMFGLFKPAIYITPQVTQNKQTMNHVITHELCHYAQLDHIWSVVRILCIALYWFNPLVWAAAVCSRSDCELSCDELAVKRLGEGNRLNYGKTLVELVQSRPSFSSLTCTATTMVAKKSQIKKRINMIVKSPKTIVWALVVLVLVLGVVVACTFTGAEKDKADDSKVLSVKTLDTLGLTATLPDGLKLNDINYDKYNQTSVAWDAYEDVTVDNFIIAMNILDQKSEELYKDIPVLHINAFEWSEGAPEDYTYRLVGENAGDKTYEEIKPYIIYQDDSRLVVEISAFTGENYKADMEKYIEENEGKGRFEGSSAPIANEPFANGRDVYDYGWVPSAFNVITANKNKLIVPEPPEQGLTRTVTFEFPARKITNPNGLPIIDEINATEKFYLKVTLPNSWTAQGYKEVYEETVPMGDFYTPNTYTIYRAKMITSF